MGKPIQEMNIEELRRYRVTMWSVGGVVGVVIALYIGYLGLQLYAGTWTSSHTLATVPLMGMVVALMVPLRLSGAASQELAKRQATNDPA